MSETEARQIGHQQFVALLHESEQKRTRAQSITGEVGERIKNAVEGANLNRKAFNLVRAMHRMDELKRKDFRASLDLYLDYMDEHVWKGSEHIGDLADMAGQGGSEPDPDAEAAARNAAALDKGIKQLDEEPAGEGASADEWERAAPKDEPAEKPRRRRGVGGDAPSTYSMN